MSRDTTPLEGQLKNFISDGTPPEIIARYESLPERAQRSNFGRFDNNVVVLDTETTGFSLAHDELTQIAAARVENGEIVDWFVTFVNPGKPIPEDVAHLTDIHDEDVADAPSASEALADLATFVGVRPQFHDEPSDGLSAAREHLGRFPRFVPHRAAPHEIPSTHRSCEGLRCSSVNASG